MMMKSSQERSPLEKEILNINNKKILILDQDSNMYKLALLILDKNSLLMKKPRISDLEENYKNSKADWEMPPNKRLDWWERVWTEVKFLRLSSKEMKE